MWHRIENIITQAETAAEAQVTIPADSAWFDGHFPGMPLLPGIAQLAMLEQVIARAWPPERRALKFSRVRFKLKIDPGTPVTVKVTRNKDKQDLFSFQIATAEGVACVGNVQTCERRSLNRPPGS
jgi:3-hydroxymyristoyl/3-hydroxydecanoyl-(acyl carrier protein) dehydratase